MRPARSRRRAFARHLLAASLGILGSARAADPSDGASGEAPLPAAEAADVAPGLRLALNAVAPEPQGVGAGLHGGAAEQKPLAAGAIADSPPVGSDVPADPLGEGLRSGALVIAQAPQSGSVVPAPENQVPPAARQELPALGSGFRFRLAPVRWTGNLADIVTWTKSDGAPDQLSNVVFGSVAGSTYIWQPWFAQVSGSLGVINGATWYSGNASEFSSVNTRDTSLTGGAALSMFPASRFPFAASFEVTDSRVSGTPVAEGYTSTRISLRQDYAPQRGNWSVSGGYDRGIIDSVSSGEDTVDVFRGSVSGGWAAQQAQLNAQYTRNQTSTGGESTFANLYGRHGWQISPRLGVDTYLNASLSELTAGQGLTRFNNRTTVGDLNSFVNWQPDTEKPLLIVGSARLNRLQFETEANSAAFQTAALSANANYSYSRNISLFGNAQVTYADAGEAGSDVLSLLSGGASYNSDPHNIWNFTYNWNASANGAFETGGQQGSGTTLFGILGQNFFRSLQASERSTVGFGLAQSVGFGRGLDGTNTVTLGNTLNSSWTFQQSEAFLTTLAGNLSDSRSLTGSGGNFQQASLQLTGNMLFSRYSTGAANITVQATRTDGLEQVPSDLQMNYYGSVSYQHLRAFGVPGLRYTLLYTGNSLQINGRQQGNLDAIPNQATQTLDQRLNYRIGRLELETLLRFSEQNGLKNAFLLFRINRTFGSF